MKFELTIDETKKAAGFEANHNCGFKKDSTGNPYAGAIGGSLSYVFTGTSLGQIVTVKCGCGKELCLTDFNEW